MPTFHLSSTAAVNISSILISSNMWGYDKTCIQGQATSRVRKGTHCMVIFQVFRTCLVPSLPRASPFQEPLIRMSSFCREVVSTSCSLRLPVLREAVLRTVSFWCKEVIPQRMFMSCEAILFCSICSTYPIFREEDPCSLCLWGGPLSLMFCEADLYQLCFKADL